MSEAEGGGEKREEATPRRLRDARKRGQVASSRDLSRTATALIWLGLLIGLPAYLIHNLGEFSKQILRQSGELAGTGLVDIVWHAGSIVLKLSALPVALVAVTGVIVTRLQTGPVFSMDRIRPLLSNINPANGAKRLFSVANLFETLKGLVKTAIILGIVVLVVYYSMNDIVSLVSNQPIVYAETDHLLHIHVLGITCSALLIVSVADWLFQRFNYLRSLRMSKQEVRREHQSLEGDPQLRSQRKRLQRQWATGNTRQASRDATALVINPTHIAVALFYDPETTTIPLVTATGEGQLAAIMRLEAETAGVPVMRSIPLARRLYFLCEDDEEVPEILFDAVAEVLSWAEVVRAANDAGDSVRTYREADRAFDHLADID